MAVGPYDMTTVAELKSYLDQSGALAGISTLNDYLQEVITGISRQIEGYLGRNIKARDYWEWKSPPPNGRPLLLKQYPLLSMYGLFFGSGSAFHAQRDATGVVSAMVTVTDAAVILKEISTAGTTTTTTLLFATYPTTALMAAAVAGTSGWSISDGDNVQVQRMTLGSYNALEPATASLQYAAKISDLQPADASISAIGTRTVTSLGIFAYPFAQAISAGGVISQFLCWYRAGYEEIPYDLNITCQEMCAEWIQTYGKQDLKVSNDNTQLFIRSKRRIDQYRRLHV